MTLPVTGPLSLSQVNTELGLASNAPISLGQATVRALAGVSTGPISISNLRGKSNYTGGVQITSGVNDTLYGFQSGVIGSISPSTLQGNIVHEIVNSSGFGIGWILLQAGGRLTGTTIVWKNNSGTVLGSWPLPAPYDDTVGTYYVWSTSPYTSFLIPAGSIHRVEIT